MYFFVLGFTGIFLDGFPNFVRSAQPMEQLVINLYGSSCVADGCDACSVRDRGSVVL